MRGACARGLVVVLLCLSAVLATAAMASAADPTPVGPAPSMTVPGPSAPPVITTVDPRSEGEGPADPPSPVLIAIGVVVLGALTAAGTVLVVRVTRR